MKHGIGGAAAIGPGHMPPKLASGEFYYDKLKHFKILEASKNTFIKVPMVEAESILATLYAPLENSSFVPDVVVNSPPINWQACNSASVDQLKS